MKKTIEIPEGYEARIEENKVIFEPKDSEDERIRKEIIRIVDIWTDSSPVVNGIPRETLLAYLERQKEQKLVGVEKVTHPLYVEGFEAGKEVGAQAEALKHIHTEWSEEEMKVLDSIIDDYEKAAKSFCGYDGKIMLLKAIRDGKYDLSKREWGEEDEEMLRIIINRVEKFSEWATEQGYTIDDPTMKQSPIAWLKSLLERFNLQSKQEWNEEDKKVLYEIIRNVSAYDAYTGTTYQQPERHDKKINFLRTLHPSWRPSKEQMEALEDAKMRMSLDGYGLCPLLQSLIDDLKSL